MANNILGIDFGARRIGLALANIETKRAVAYKTLTIETGVIEQLQGIIKVEFIGQIVVGLPRNLEGDDTPQTTLARTFAADLAALMGLPVHLQDEALTSEVAEQQLKSAGQKVIPTGLIDQVAAAIILQDYLDNL